MGSSVQDFEREEQALVSEAATAAWRAWRYPVDDRSARARARARAPVADLAQHSAEEREARAEAAWEEVLRRSSDLRP